MPPADVPPAIAPSLSRKKRGVGTVEDTISGHETSTNGIQNGYKANDVDNPTVISPEILENFSFAFLIRHPQNSIPSLLRCVVPPLCQLTGFTGFDPAEAGYGEVRKLFDYVRSTSQAGHGTVGQENGLTGGEGLAAANGTTRVNICVIDADDLLDKPAAAIEAFCKTFDLPYDPSMLSWDTPDKQQLAGDKFECWRGWHEDVLNSTGIHARAHVSFDYFP